MYNLPICKQKSLNGFDYISLAESKKQSFERVQKSSFFHNFNILDFYVILISIKSNSSIHALISFNIQE